MDVPHTQRGMNGELAAMWAIIRQVTDPHEERSPGVIAAEVIAAQEPKLQKRLLAMVRHYNVSAYLHRLDAAQAIVGGKARAAEAAAMWAQSVPQGGGRWQAGKRWLKKRRKTSRGKKSAVSRALLGAGLAS
jgi:hypothetical protein